VVEVAKHLDISTATTKRDWAYARAWIKAHMNEGPVL
jgi:hypothetical protein